MLYLEDFLELIEQLPSELRDRFTEMRELELSVQTGSDKADDSVKMFFNNATHLLEDERKRHAELIRKKYYKILEDADEKVHLTNSMYDLVTRFLRQLDTELGKFKMELEADNAGITEMLEKKVLEAEESQNNTKRRKRNRLTAATDKSISDFDASTSVQASTSASRQHSVDSSTLPHKVPSKASLAVSASSVSNSNSSKAMTSSVSSSSHQNAGITLEPNRNSGMVSGMIERHAILPNQQKISVTSATTLQSRRQSMSQQRLQPLALNTGQGVTVRERYQGQSNFLHAFSPSPASSTSGGEARLSHRQRKLTSRVGEMIKEMAQRQEHKDHSQQQGTTTTTTTTTTGGGSYYGASSTTPQSYQGTPPGATGSSGHLGGAGGSSEDESNDPNEPRYCICNQVSYGEMVACDNKDCPFEWFHYACVGITQPPKGKWYCPQCTAAMRRRASRMVQQINS